MKTKKKVHKYDRLKETHYCGRPCKEPPDDWKAPGKWAYCAACDMYEPRFHTTTEQIYLCLGGPKHNEYYTEKDAGEWYARYNSAGYGGPKCVLVHIRDLDN